MPAPCFSLNNACLVVAHPDDEVLWFSSIIAHVQRVVVCFLEQPDRARLNRGRRTVLDTYPLPTLTYVGLTEAGVFQQADWLAPVPSPYGLELTSRTNPSVVQRYQNNLTHLKEELRQRLAGFDTVFTHNPWGEYGHEEHVQVYRAVAAIQREKGFALWCSSYAGSRSHGLMIRCLEHARVETITRDTDPAFARRVAALYQAHGVWTWFDDYAWPRQESFLRFSGPREKGASPQPLPLHYLDMGLPTGRLAERSLRSLARKARRLLLPGSSPDTPFL